MRNALSNNWWWITVKGLLILALGLISLFVPAQTILVLTTWIGIILLLGSAFTFILLFSNWSRLANGKLLLFLDGILDAGVGLLILLYPEQTVYIVTILIAVWLVLMGILQIYYAFSTRGHLKLWWVALVNGLVTVVLGVLIGSNPFEGAKALIILFGLSACFYGIMLIIFSLRLKRWRNLDVE